MKEMEKTTKKERLNLNFVISISFHIGFVFTWKL